MSRYTSLYLLLLLLLVLFSWVGSAYGLVLPDGTLLPNLLGPDSVRYFVRHGIEHISATPVVEVLLLLLMIGAVGQSGLWNHLLSVMHLRTVSSLTRRHSYALRVSVVVFVICVAIVLMGLVGPRGNLLSVTGSIAGGPFSCGWLLLLAVCVVLPSICYGVMSGLWSSEDEVLSAITAVIARRSDYFVTLIVASQVMAAVQYLGLYQLLGWGDFSVGLFTFLIYGLPLVRGWKRGGTNQ